jgi:hypothetical protein
LARPPVDPVGHRTSPHRSRGLTPAGAWPETSHFSRNQSARFRARRRSPTICNRSEARARSRMPVTPPRPRLFTSAELRSTRAGRSTPVTRQTPLGASTSDRFDVRASVRKALSPTRRSNPASSSQARALPPLERDRVVPEPTKTRTTARRANGRAFGRAQDAFGHEKSVELSLHEPAPGFHPTTTPFLAWSTRRS